MVTLGEYEEYRLVLNKSDLVEPHPPSFEGYQHVLNRPINVGRSETPNEEKAPKTLGSHILWAGALSLAIFVGLVGVIGAIGGIFFLFAHVSWVWGTLALIGALSIVSGVSAYAALEL